MQSKTRLSPRKWLLLPIETKARELLGKTLLGCYAAERGWGVVLGEKEIVRTQQPLLPKGVILEKDADSIHEDCAVVAQANGNLLSVMDEEGLLAFSGDIYLKSRVSTKYLEALDYFFAWGDVQAGWLESIDESDGKVIRSGNPRFDLLRPEFRSYFEIEASKLRDRYGRIILFNTNFGLSNPNEGRDPLVFMKNSGKFPTRDSELLYLAATKFDRQVLEDLLAAVPLVATKYRDHTVVVRPHPSEGHEPWDEIARQHANVKVCYEASAQEWISAADVMIHSNCTTGLEAYLMGRPAISYRLRQDERFDYPVTNDVCAQAESQDELVELIDMVVGGGRLDGHIGEKAVIIDDYVSGINGRPAIETIVECLEELDVSPCEAEFPIRPERPSLARRVAYKARRLSRSISGNSTAAGAGSNQRYARKKFSGIELQELREIVSRFDRTIGRFAEIKVTQICNNTFGLYMN